jgi:hypothetical protein
MNNFDVSVIDYLGKFQNGVLVLIAITLDGQYFDATFFYTKEEIVLTISDEMEEVVGNIKEHPNYKDLLLLILKKVLPYHDIADRIDDVDFGKWIKGQIELFSDDEPEIIPDGVIKNIKEDNE